MRNEYGPGTVVHAFGRNVRTERRAQGLSMRELAARAGVGLNVVQRCETATNAISLDKAVAIAHALGTPVSELTGEGW